MKKVIDNPRLIYKCCKLYYENEMSQADIAESLGVSRVSVSRMIRAGQERGYVQIRVISPGQLGSSRLEESLIRLCGLAEAVVIDGEASLGGADQVSVLRTSLISLLEAELRETDYVGVSMGHTLMSIYAGSHQNAGRIGCTFIPMVGGVSLTGQSTEAIHSNQIARGFADMFGGRYMEFFSPAVFSDAALMQSFMQEQANREILASYDRLDAAIMGIGMPDSTSLSTMEKAGYTTRDEIRAMTERGMVGDISLQYFNAEGDGSPFRDFNSRVAGLPLEKLRLVPKKICIAAGREKAAAIRAAIRGGYVNILVTDTECARALIEAESEI